MNITHQLTEWSNTTIKIIQVLTKFLGSFFRSVWFYRAALNVSACLCQMLWQKPKKNLSRFLYH